ncbi:hypothetical protein ZWY2020_058427 [Hordeum vulgare]|nr:hypothetical protein ZWY2020_058427 [Hordeum vulgare]
MGSPQAVAAQCPEGHAFRRAGTGHVDDGNRRHLGPPGFGRRRSRQQSTPRAERRTSKSRSAYGRGASPAPIRFPPGNFKHSLTLFSKSFSSFSRTCSPSVSLRFSLGGCLPPFLGCFPKQPDWLTAPGGATGSGPDGLTSQRLFPGLGPVRRRGRCLQITSGRQPPIIKLGCSRFATIRRILVSFFSSAYLYA